MWLLKVVRAPAAKRAAKGTLLLGGFVLGGYIGGGTPWLRWFYGEATAMLASSTFKAVVTSWPLGVVVAALLFRHSLVTAIIPRLTKLKWGEAEAEMAPLQQRAPEPPPLAPPAAREPPALDRAADPAAPPGEGMAGYVPRAQHAADLALAAIPDAYFIEREVPLREELARIGVDADPAQANRVLVRYTAGWYAIAEFERLLGLIYGGQVTLLRQLNAGPLSTDEAQRAFADWAARNPGWVSHHSDDQAGFDRWIGFLTLSGVAFKGEDGRFGITAKGRSFLLFLARSGRPEPLLA